MNEDDSDNDGTSGDEVLDDFDSDLEAGELDDDDLDDDTDEDKDLDDEDLDDEDLEEDEDLNDDDLDDEDDVEADLDAILKERIAAGDDQIDDDEEETSAARSTPNASGEVEPVVARGDNEFSCPHCFLLVNRAVVDDECPHCGGPVGAT